MQRGILLEIPGFQTQFYQLLMDEITSFFCLSDKQCNELFKRRLTFSSRSNIIVITANNVRWGIEKFIWDTLNTYFVPSYSSSYYSLIYLHNSMSSPIFENQRVIAVFLEHQRVSQMPLNFKNLNSNKIPRLSCAPCSIVQYSLLCLTKLAAWRPPSELAHLIYTSICSQSLLSILVQSRYFEPC